MILNISKARRDGAKIIIALAGVSGGGKTRTALEIAIGLAKGKPDKIGFLDTENKRGTLYADVFGARGQFLHGDFQPPFSPVRYGEAIKEFEQAGVEVLIIDSISHEWEGVGGCEEIATEGDPKVARWNKAKSLHRRHFMNALLQSSMHIICCVRAREKVDMKNPREVKSLGIQPICEKNFMFEMTFSVMMSDSGQKQEVLKKLDAAAPFLGKGYLGQDLGLALRQWVDGGATIDKELATVRSKLLLACEGGMKSLEAEWTVISLEHKKLLKSELETFKSSAAGYDQHRKETDDSADAQTAVDAATKALAAT
jgi:hypothetical protein